MIKVAGNVYQLYTEHTSYQFRVTGSGHLEHLYYGKIQSAPSAAEASEMGKMAGRRPGNTISYDAAYPELALEDLCLEISARGKGDVREPFIALTHADGGRTSDFLFRSAKILPEKAPYETLPGSYGMEENEHLCVTLKDAQYGLVLELHYYVYAECDVICRSARLVNESAQSVHIDRLMSLLMDVPGTGYVMTTFTGAWAREMERQDTAVSAGTHSVSSVCGITSNRANPFFMVSRPGTGEESGECMAFNLVYSGNHYEAVQAGAFGKTRIMTGINPDGFGWLLTPGETFEAPEAIMAFSADGHGTLSRSMHRFLRTHIIRGIWRDRVRPILVNSWEAFYFDFNEARLLELARTGRDVGAELFVLDDGWFAGRNDDKTSLGDWEADPEKLPDGLAGLAEKIKETGLAFGLWIEPEMVSTDSALYRAHPDWAMEIPGRPHAEGRSQRVLDLANPAVLEYLTGTLTRLLASAEISYVKWDMNRIFSDVYSPYLPPERQDETAHRYVLHLYRLLETLTAAFPQILFEGCASGGGRFDPGMLCYFPQIWGSDNTDPVCRVQIQEGYSYGYPQNCVGAHVSASPNHQTGRETSLKLRFHAALSGVLGYECNLNALMPEELEEIRRQTAWYKEWRPVLQQGQLHRIGTKEAPGWRISSPDGMRQVSFLLHCPPDEEGGAYDSVLQISEGGGFRPGLL